jgi:hypothetical protein
VNQNKPVFIMPSLPNATIEVPEVCWCLLQNILREGIIGACKIC